MPLHTDAQFYCDRHIDLPVVLDRDIIDNLPTVTLSDITMSDDVAGTLAAVTQRLLTDPTALPDHPDIAVISPYYRAWHTRRPNDISYIDITDLTTGTLATVECSAIRLRGITVNTENLSNVDYGSGMQLWSQEHDYSDDTVAAALAALNTALNDSATMYFDKPVRGLHSWTRPNAGWYGRTRHRIAERATRLVA